MKLTEQQRELAGREETLAACRVFAKRLQPRYRWIDYDTLLSLAHLAACKLAGCFDSRKSKWLYFLNRCLAGRISNEIRLMEGEPGSKRRAVRCRTEYTDAGDPPSREPYVGYDSDETEAFEFLIRGLTDRQKKLAREIALEGLTKSESAALAGTTRSAVDESLKLVRRKICT